MATGKTHWLVRGIVILIILIALVFVYMSFNLNRLAKQAIESNGSAILQVPVHVNSVTLSPLNGKGRLSHVVIANPPGYTSANAFELEDISITVDLTSLITSQWVIKELHVNKAQLSVEQKQIIYNNLRTLLNNIPKRAQTTATPSASHAAPTQHKVIIKQFTFKGGQMHLINDGKVEKTLPIADVVLNDVGEKDRALTFAQATQQLLGPVIQAALTESVAAGFGLEGKSKKLMEEASKAGSDLLEEAKSIIKSTIGNEDEGVTEQGDN